MPVTKKVRDAEKLETGDDVWARMQIVDL